MHPCFQRNISDVSLLFPLIHPRKVVHYMEGLWRGWHFAMIGMKKLQDILGEGYALLSNGNARIFLTFKNFWLVLLFQTPYSTI